METAADFVTEVPMIMAVPPVITFLLFIWVVGFLGVLVYVYT